MRGIERPAHAHLHMCTPAKGERASKKRSERSEKRSGAEKERTRRMVRGFQLAGLVDSSASVPGARIEGSNMLRWHPRAVARGAAEVLSEWQVNLKV